MTARRSSSPDRARLLSLLRRRHDRVGPFSFATDDTLAVARALGPEVAAEAVSSVLAAHAPGGDHRLAERAAHVAHELRLVGAIPALVSCVERLPHGDPVAHVSSAALGLIGPPAVAPLVEAFRRATHSDVRFAIGAALTLMPADGGPIRAALEGALLEDPGTAAQLLGVHGDRAAVPALRATLERLELPPAGAGELGAVEAIVLVGEALLALGGRMTPPQRARFERACARVDELAGTLGDDRRAGLQ